LILFSPDRVDERREKLKEILKVLSSLDIRSPEDAELALRTSVLLFRLLVLSRQDQEVISLLRTPPEDATEFGKRVLLFCLALILEPYDPIESSRLMEDSRSWFKKEFGLDPESLVGPPHRFYSFLHLYSVGRWLSRPLL